MLRVGITGGIGSGKSTVCRVFATLGIPVYESDTRAKEIMDTDAAVASHIKVLFGEDIYADGALDRKRVAEAVFQDKTLLEKLNGIVHPAVGRDFERWAESHEQEGAPYVVLESAILFESGFDRYCEVVVTVSAPIEERIERTVLRDGMTADRVRERMANQMTDSQREARADYVIYNAERELATEQVLALHKRFISSK
jgi:dephospho-CoA kinase